jgi:hypothetical protein
MVAAVGRGSLFGGDYYLRFDFSVKLAFPRRKVKTFFCKLKIRISVRRSE